MRARAGRLAPLAGLALGVLLVAGCSQAGAADDGSSVAVTARDDACELETTQLTAGTTTFAVTNEGSQVTEFYVLREDGVAIVSEVENIGPGTTRDLTVQLDAGRYVYACKPGQTGDGLRGDLTVTG